MQRPPRTYAEWSACLDALAQGSQDEACLTIMRQGELAWSGGVATLFSQRMADEFNARLNRCSEFLNRDLRIRMDENLVVRAILNARKQLYFLHRLASVESFPDTLRVHLVSEVRRFAERAQQSLENSAESDRSGRLKVLLRNNHLMRYEEMATTPAMQDTAPSLTLYASSGAASPAGSATASTSSVAAAAPSGGRRRNILI